MVGRSNPRLPSLYCSPIGKLSWQHDGYERGRYSDNFDARGALSLLKSTSFKIKCYKFCSQRLLQNWNSHVKAKESAHENEIADLR